MIHLPFLNATVTHAGIVPQDNMWEKDAAPLNVWSQRFDDLLWVRDVAQKTFADSKGAGNVGQYVAIEKNSALYEDANALKNRQGWWEKYEEVCADRTRDFSARQCLIFDLTGLVWNLNSIRFSGIPEKSSKSIGKHSRFHGNIQLLRKQQKF